MVFDPRFGMFDPLSNEEAVRIHHATLALLERTGVKFDNEVALKLLADNGAEVDHKTRIVRIPQYLVEETIRKAQRSILFAGRDPRHDIRLSVKTVHFGTGGGAIGRIDPITLEIRSARKSDVADACKLVDFLPNVNFAMSLFCSRDVPEELVSLHDLDAMLHNTQKPVMIVDYGTNVDYMIDMAAAVVGGREALRKRPILGMYSEPVSPLTHSREHVNNIMKFAKAMLPVVYIPSPLMGASSPATIAGTVVQFNAETLSGNVLMQLVSPGSPYIYGADATVMDMRTGVFSYGAPEWMVNNLILANLGRYYGLPTWSTGGCSDSKILDGQATLEAGLTLYNAAASGANLIHDFGFLDFGLTGSLELVTIDDEIASYTRRTLSGENIDRASISLELIDKIGPGGSYLATSQTRAVFEKDHWKPQLLDRNPRKTWEAQGKKSLVQRAAEKTKMILETHKVEPLSSQADNKIKEILLRAEKEILGNKG
jgi:trimethylamine--corrinoid protein Co-methyltransferase